jgi:dipeptidyl aminopeptidase/acylaminoacyl peptidase
MTRIRFLLVTLAASLLTAVSLSWDRLPIEKTILFQPRPVDVLSLATLPLAERDVEEIRLKTPDGPELHGWLKRPAGARPGKRFPLVIVYGGIRREVSEFVRLADAPRGWGFLVVNYRGFGLSEGTPTEKAVLEDAKLVYDWAAANPEVDDRNIVVLGRSFGSYVAVAVAAARNARAAILATPFDSFVSLGEQWLPRRATEWLLGHHFDSAFLAPKIAVPALFVLAENDDVTPVRNGLALMRRWGGWTKSVLLPGANHYGIEKSDEFWRSVHAFLGELDRMRLRTASGARGARHG